MDIYNLNNLKRLKKLLANAATDTNKTGDGSNTTKPVSPVINEDFLSFNLVNFVFVDGVDSDIHVSTDWEIYDIDEDTLIESSYEDTVNLLKYSPSVIISGLNIKVRARFNGQNSGPGGWGEQRFTPITKSDIGSFGQGGYYAGIIDTTSTGGLRYAVIVSPKAKGQNPKKQWKVEDTITENTDSYWDGWTNTNNMNDENHPAAQWIRSLTIEGYNDWYLPAVDELELIYRSFKPGTTVNTMFKDDTYSPYISEDKGDGYNLSSDPNGLEYTEEEPSQTDNNTLLTIENFNNFQYWTSTNCTDTTAFGQNFNNGVQYGGYGKTEEHYVRAIRRVLL